MFNKIKQLFDKRSPQEKAKDIIDWTLNWIVTDEKVLNNYWFVEAFKGRQDMRPKLVANLYEEIEEILQETDIYKAFRKHILDTMQIAVTYESLVDGSFDDAQVERICGAINEGIAHCAGNEQLSTAHQYVYTQEAFPDYNWSYKKAVFENVWAEIKLMVYRQLQVQMFENVDLKTKEKDWWDLYREGFTIYTTDTYKFLLKGEDKRCPHPVVLSMGNDVICDMRSKLT